jgi:hypothetical protein
MGRTLGIILIAGGLIVGIIIGVLMTVYRGEGSLSAGAATLGMVIGLLVLVLPQLGVGAFLLWRGSQEAAAAVEANKQRDLLNMVKTRGQIAVADLVIELRSSRDEVNQMIHQLVGMGLFSGYVNWEEGILYSRQASELRQLSNCQHCNGELQLAGKGIIRCPYCGTEYYLD